MHTYTHAHMHKAWSNYETGPLHGAPRYVAVRLHPTHTHSETCAWCVCVFSSLRRAMLMALDALGLRNCFDAVYGASAGSAHHCAHLACIVPAMT